MLPGRTVKHLIANLKRNFNISGSNIYALLDTNFVGIDHHTAVPYVSLAVDHPTWTLLTSSPHCGPLGKHPILRGDFIKQGEYVYIRKISAGEISNYTWSKHLQANGLSIDNLVSEVESVLANSRSTLKHREVCQQLHIKLRVYR